MTLFVLKGPKGLTVVSYVKFTQESENPFLTSIRLDLRPENQLQSRVPFVFLDKNLRRRNTGKIAYMHLYWPNSGTFWLFS